MTTAARQYREMQSELAHANRVATMGQLAASIAHEVNQPIASGVINALAGLRWLNHPTPDLEEVRRALAAVVSEGNRAGEVINRIRDLIKKAPPRKDRLEINEVIREVIELTRGEAVKNGVSVEMQFAEGLPLIEGDRVQLQQVILNLVLNSVQAMSATSDGRRQLLVTTGKAHSDGVLVAVRDSGPGLAPAALEHIFEAFYTTKPDGMGMGLSICRSIVEAHGGRLSASGNEGPGATFQFVMPLHQEDSTAARSASVDERMNCESFAVSERWPDEGHVNRTVPQSLDQVRSVALHWRQQHVRIAFSIGLNESRHARLEVGCPRESDPDASGFAACPISNICLCPFHVLQNLPRFVEQQCPGLGKLDAARQTAE